jgi:retron-type reverse transcriptase
MTVRSKCLKWDLTLTLQRFYLDKGMEKVGIPNGKYRPIGAPTLVSRVIVKGLNDMIYYINKDNFKDFQHGYRINKGCHTALYKV